MLGNMSSIIIAGKDILRLLSSRMILSGNVPLFRNLVSLLNRPVSAFIIELWPLMSEFHS